jgi:hypothetical protein
MQPADLTQPLCSEGIADKDGSSIDLIIIPVVVVISLAAWLLALAYAATQLEWKHGPASREDSPMNPLPGVGVPFPRTEIQRPVCQPTEIQAHGHRRARQYPYFDCQRVAAPPGA